MAFRALTNKFLIILFESVEVFTARERRLKKNENLQSIR